MGTRARDFSGNEIYDIERETDLNDKLSMIEEALSKAEGERDWAEAEYRGWQDNVAELEALLQNTQSDIDAEDEQCLGCDNHASDDGGWCDECREEWIANHECLYCDDEASIKGLCGDCNKNEEMAARDGW